MGTGDGKTTKVHRIARVAAADARWGPRKIVDILLVLAGLYLIVSRIHHDDTHWEAWILLGAGAGDLGIQIGGIQALKKRAGK